MFQETDFIRTKLRVELAATVAFALMTIAAIVPLLLILGYLFFKAFPALSWEFVSAFPRKGNTAGGIFPAILGTFYMVALSLLIACPIGVLAAVYLNEYAGDNWFTRIVNLAVLNLAGVPSIVHALFGLAAFVSFTGKPCILAASLTLAIMTLPVIIASTKQALAAVPMAFREACWNVGASRWQVIRTIVLPNSISGILTGIILQVSRAAGETAPIMFTGALLFKKGLPASVMDQSMALSMHLFNIATQGARVSEEIQYGTALVLLGLVLLVNATSILFRVYFRSRKKW
jgi:phosphate transport system permease protein